MDSFTVDLAKYLPKPVSSLANSVTVSWHVFDISSNYILKKINWADMVINLKDDKLLICFAFTYYKSLTREMAMSEVKACIPAPCNIDVTMMRDYFKLSGFESIFSDQDQEMISMCQLTHDDFIVLPIYESKSHIYMALLNINVEFGLYLQSLYNPTASSSNDNTSFCNLFEIEHGLQNHASITGIQHATSFNLFRALYKSSLGSLAKPVASNHSYAYNSKLIKLTDIMELPVIALYNCYNYWPQLQVVWTCNKIMIALPGAKKPTNESLLRNNKLLARVYEDSLFSLAGKPASKREQKGLKNSGTSVVLGCLVGDCKSPCKRILDPTVPLKLNSKPTLSGREFNVTSVPLHWAYNPVHTVPKVMLRKYETNIDKVRTRWIEKYKKFCQAQDGEPICQYTNLDKLINQMSKIKLEVQDLCSLQSQKD